MTNSYRWLVVAVTVVNQAVTTGVCIYCFAIFSIPWLEQFDISRGQLMLAITAFQIANGLGSMVIGPKLDKMSLLWPVICGYLLFCIGLGLISVANAFWQIIVIYATFFATGQILAGTFVSQMLINRWFSTDKGLALGISATGTSLGGILFPLLVAYILTTSTLPPVFQGFALVYAVVLIPLNYLILRIPPPLESQTQDNTGTNTASTWTTKEILTSKAFWIPGIVLLSISTSFVAIQSNLGIHLDALNYSASFTGQMIALISAMMIVGKLACGKLSDKFDHASILFFMGSMNMVAIAVLMSTSTKILLLTAAVLLGTASGGLIPVMGVVYAARFGLASFGKVVGLYMLVLVFGSLGSIYAAWIYDIFGSYHYAFISFILLTIPGLILLKWLPPPLESE